MHGLTNTTNRRILALIGAVAIASGTIMTSSFGYSMSLLHAISLGLLTIAAGTMWGPIDELHAAGHTNWARFFRVVGACFIAAELASHVGYTMGNRVENAEQAAWKNAKAIGVVDNSKLNTGQLEVLKAELARLTAEKPWAATVTADGLRAKLQGANLAIAQEAKRGGCGPKCLKLTQDRDELQAQIGVAERKVDLEKQIADLGRVVNERADKAEATEYTSVKTVAQTQVFGQIFTASLRPTEEARTWTDIGVGLFVALVTTFLGPVCWRLATAGTGAPFAAPVPAGPASAPTELGPSARPETPPAPMPVKVAQRIPSGLEGLRAFLEDVNRHARRIGAPEYKGAV